MVTDVGLSRVHFPITALGPGRRIGIWFQGCAIRCRGCMSLDTWEHAASLIPVSALLAQIAPWLPEADGITISGGEPFDQPHALEALVRGLRASFAKSILVYSGCSFEDLHARHLHTLALIDVLISEPFDATASSGALLRGSANQRVHLLTQTGTAMWNEAERDGPAKMDVMASDDGTLWVAGIPHRGDLDRLSSGLGQDGITAKTSAGRLGRERLGRLGRRTLGRTV